MSYPHIPSLLHASCSHVLVFYILQEAHVKIRRLNVEFVGWQRMRVTWVGMVSTDDNTLTYINIFLTLTERIHMEDLGKMKKKLNIPSLQCHPMLVNPLMNAGSVYLFTFLNLANAYRFGVFPQPKRCHSTQPLVTWEFSYGV